MHQFSCLNWALDDTQNKIITILKNYNNVIKFFEKLILLNNL